MKFKKTVNDLFFLVVVIVAFTLAADYKKSISKKRVKGALMPSQFASAKRWGTFLYYLLIILVMISYLLSIINLFSCTF